MNSYELNFLEEAASRKWRAVSAKIRVEVGSGSCRVQAFSLHSDNKINAVDAANKYFLTIFCRQSVGNDCAEPKAWLHS